MLGLNAMSSFIYLYICVCVTEESTEAKTGKTVPYVIALFVSTELYQGYKLYQVRYWFLCSPSVGVWFNKPNSEWQTPNYTSCCGNTGIKEDKGLDIKDLLWGRFSTITGIGAGTLQKWMEKCKRLINSTGVFWAMRQEIYQQYCNSRNVIRKLAEQWV